MQINKINFNSYKKIYPLKRIPKPSFKGEHHIPRMMLNVDFDKFIKQQQQIKIDEELAKLNEQIEINDYDPTRLRNKLEEQYQRLTLEEQKEFHKYYKSIDFKKISKIAPEIDDYSETKKRLFAIFHFIQAKHSNPFEPVKKPRFTKEDLTYTQDLTQELKNRYINANEMEYILLAYPATERTIGELPDDLIFDDGEDKTRLYMASDAISDFAVTNDTIDLASKLSRIFGKIFQVDEIASGSYGSCFKLSAKGINPLCLKVFKRTPINTCDNTFGKCAEPQIGIYGNEHSNELVKMFFGKVATEKDIDGFIVTQFLDTNTKPIDSKQSSSKEIIIQYIDKRPSNIINKKIIDYGGIIFK